MTTVIVLENLKTFLLDNVCNSIKLQKPSDEEVDKYELVNPSVHIGWIPPKGFLPTELESAIPCLVVGMDDGNDDGREGNVVIRLSVAVYSPGQHTLLEDETVECTPNFEGYKDLLNLIDLTIAEIAKNQIINGVPIEYPIKWGIYQETQPYPYWYGWVSFSIKKQSYQPALIAQKYL